MNLSSAVTVTDRPPYLASASQLHEVRAGFVPPTNSRVKDSSGTETAYGPIYAGTVMAKDADDSYIRGGLVELTAAIGGSDTIVTVGATHQAAFRVGDKVAVIDEVLYRDIAVAGEADDETFTSTGAHGLKVGDWVELVSGFTGGSGASAGKYKVATTPSITTFTLSGVAYTTDISGGTVRVANDGPIYVNLTGDRYITAINTGTGAITLSGANIAAAAITLNAKLLVKLGAYRPAGILDRNISTLQTMLDGSTVQMGETVPIRHAGEVRKSKIVGSSTLVQKALSGAPWTDPLTNTPVVPYVGGIKFLNL